MWFDENNVLEGAYRSQNRPEHFSRIIALGIQSGIPWIEGTGRGVGLFRGGNEIVDSKLWLKTAPFCVLVAFFNLGDRRHFAFEESPNDCDIGTMHLGPLIS